MKLLFLCTGNTCRSCMAEALANKIVKDMNIGLQINSAGLFAENGSSASENAMLAMEEYGLDLTQHRSKRLTHGMLMVSDLVLTMTNNHKSSVLDIYPEFKDKVFTLSEYVGEMGEVSDPFGGDIEVYRKSATQLKNMINKVLIKIKGSYSL